VDCDFTPVVEFGGGGLFEKLGKWENFLKRDDHIGRKKPDIECCPDHLLNEIFV
jgi:hypothetical protein